MAKLELHSLFKGLRGQIQGLVFRRSHNGDISMYASPDMRRVTWSPAQVAHRERMAEAAAYAKAAIADPQIRPIYEQVSMQKKGNKRPYDMAVSDYMNGNNLLGDKFDWNVKLWRAQRAYKRRKKR